jgi:formaldehyde-activating enzyme involved in methanogenesis
MNKSHLIPDVINYLMSKAINATSQNERQIYQDQLRAIREEIDKALSRSMVSNIKTRKRA